MSIPSCDSRAGRHNCCRRGHGLIGWSAPTRSEYFVGMWHVLRQQDRVSVAHDAHGLRQWPHARPASPAPSAVCPGTSAPRPLLVPSLHAPGEASASLGRVRRCGVELSQVSSAARGSSRRAVCHDGRRQRPHDVAVLWARRLCTRSADGMPSVLHRGATTRPGPWPQSRG